MFDIVFYENNRGEKPVREYIIELATKNNKDARIKANKIAEYIDRLKLFGTRIGKPFVDKIEGTALWELRPLSDRIFFAYWKDDTFILLHHFVKKSNKTPKLEIQLAENRLKDYLERFGD